MQVWIDGLSQMTGKSKNQIIERLCRYATFVMSEQNEVYKRQDRKEKAEKEDVVWMLAGKTLYYMIKSDLKNEPKQYN